jgi:hypothetical protein
MTDKARWYILDFNDGERVTAGGGAVSVVSFQGPLSTRDGETRFSLRLWRASDHPDEMAEAERAEAREQCLLAVGSADELAIELHTAGARYQVGRGDAGPSRTLRFNLGHEVTVTSGETFNANEAGQLFLSYFQTGTVPYAEYRLRELEPADMPSPTHALTVNYDKHRPVLPTADAGEFSAFLDDTETSVLVLWRIPPGQSLADLTDEEKATHHEFMQTAGSSGRFTVEIRQRDKLYTVGRMVDDLVWGTPTTDIAVGSTVLQVYPNEVFDPAEVGTLFRHYLRTGGAPGKGYLLGEIELT